LIGTVVVVLRWIYWDCRALVGSCKGNFRI